MRRIAVVSSIALALGCAGARPAPLATSEAATGTLLRGPELARVRCLLVAPFENASDAPLAADTATAAVLSGVDPARARVFPVSDLRALFRDTPLELPQGVGPSLALELAELVGADAVLYGAVEGRSRDAAADVLVTMRLSLTGDRHLLFATTALARPAAGEAPDAAVRRAVYEATRPLLARIGDPGRKRCFDPERTRTVRKFALAEREFEATRAAARPSEASASEPPPIAPAVAATASAAPEPPKARTPRQAEWAKKLSERGRILVEEVAFSGRTADLQRDRGLADLAMALAAAPSVKVRLEGFVDTTSDPGGDARLSMAMAQTAGQRLVELGVAKDRISWAGRGGESPLLPNFTARGRAANRRVEAVGLR